MIDGNSNISPHHIIIAYSNFATFKNSDHTFVLKLTSCILCHWKKGVVSKMVVFKIFLMSRNAKSKITWKCSKTISNCFLFPVWSKNSLFDNWFWWSLNLCTQISLTHPACSSCMLYQGIFLIFLFFKNIGSSKIHQPITRIAVIRIFSEQLERWSWNCKEENWRMLWYHRIWNAILRPLCYCFSGIWSR